MVLRIDLRDEVYMRTGTMIAYRGGIKFNRLGLFSYGLGKGWRKFIAGESGKVTRASGAGQLWLAQRAKRIHVLRLGGEPVCVNGMDLLAFEPTVGWDVQFMKKASSLFTSGLYNIRLDGAGSAAITTYGQPLVLKVTPDQPVITDPHATVAWSGSLEAELRLDFEWKALIGRGSGEFLQAAFRGDGFVIVQPCEEKPFSGGSGGGGDAGDGGDSGDGGGGGD
jgi:uncharacterized protein (AIM24 family)